MPAVGLVILSHLALGSAAALAPLAAAGARSAAAPPATRDGASWGERGGEGPGAGTAAAVARAAAVLPRGTIARRVRHR